MNSERARCLVNAILTNLGLFTSPIIGTRIIASSMKPQPDIRLFRFDGEEAHFATNGYIEADVIFASSGNYRFEVLARGAPAEGIYPILELRIDGKAVGKVELKGWGWQRRAVTSYVEEGRHKAAIAFVNDLWLPEKGEDRNAFVHSILITR